MLTNREIITSFTKIVNSEFNIDTHINTTNQGFDKECFYVSLVPLPSKRVAKRAFEKNLIVSIKYFGNCDKMQLYDVASELEALFSREVKIKDRIILISKCETNYLKDEVGNYLDFLITISFNENDKKTQEEIEIEQSTELMGEIKINERVIT